MGTIKSKFGPLPVWGWLALVTVILLAYYLYEQHKKGAASSTTPATPSDVGQPGVVVINQGDTDVPPAPSPAPIPPVPVKPPVPPEGTRQITVTKGETLGELAKQRHWSAETLQDVESMNVTAGQGKWTPSTRLTKGQEVIRPLKGG
jgi:hypothetical protein